MTLNYLQNKIELELKNYSLKEIRAAYEEMSNFYRKDREKIHLSLNSTPKRLAYIAARMPATFSSVHNVLQNLNHKDKCTSLLDIGAGCGTASFAASEVLPNLNKIIAIEQNTEMIKIGKKLTDEHSVLQNMEWIKASMLSPECQFPESDIIILSYSLNEIPKEKRNDLILKLWNSTKMFLVIIEPGSKECFHLIHSIRGLFIQNKNAILAPCPHENTCPAFTNNDFCHFSSRVQRTSLHRYLKNAERNFEDEKYSYLILTKMPKRNYSARVVRKPSHRSGLISLQLCHENGFISKIYSKKDKEIYQDTKGAQWGDEIEIVQ